MSEPRRPAPQPHPQPRPVPGRSRPTPGAPAATPAPLPHPSDGTTAQRKPQPVAAPTTATAHPSAADPPAAGRQGNRSRAQRLRAERRARRLRLQRALQIAGAALSIVVVVSVVLALTSGGGGSPAHSESPPGTPSATAADLAFPAAATSFLGSAASDIAAVTTYDYRHLDDALSAGLAVTTGTYREQYRLALTGDLARTATAEHVVHTFEVLDVGIGAMTPAQAKVLVFGRERVIDDSTGPDGQVTPITLTATVKRLGNRYLISALAQNVDPGLPPGGPDLTVAVEAARTEVVNTLSYQRPDFDADLQRSLDGATNPLRDDLRRSAPDLRAAMTAGKYDTSGQVTETAVVRADPDTVTVMVVAQESRAVDGQTGPTVIEHRYEVTVTRTGSGWAASRIASVDGDS